MARLTLTQARKKVQDNVLTAYQETVKKSSEDMILNTPVDSGKARGNWNTRLNSSDTYINESARDPSGAASMAKNKTVVDRATIKDDIFFTNNVPYIQVLENGDVHHIPAGMRAIAKANILLHAITVARRIV